MNVKKNYYCRLEIFCCNFNLENRGYIKEKSWDLKKEYVYVENITTIDLLKDRILHFSKVWKKMHLKSISENYATEYVGFPIFNKWHDYAVVGFCPKGWLFIENSFATYVHKYLIETCNDKYSDCLKAIEGNSYDFNLITNYVENDMHLITEELMDIELKHFLDKTEITEEIEQKVYYPEMLRRGYIDIIGKIK